LAVSVIGRYRSAINRKPATVAPARRYRQAPASEHFFALSQQYMTFGVRFGGLQLAPTRGDNVHDERRSNGRTNVTDRSRDFDFLIGKPRVPPRRRKERLAGHHDGLAFAERQIPRFLVSGNGDDVLPEAVLTRALEPEE
jgi:hypothetical protein